MVTQQAFTIVVQTDQLLDLKTFFGNDQKTPASVMLVIIPQGQINDDPDWILPPADHDTIFAQAKKERESGETVSHTDVLMMLQKRGITN